MTLTATDYFCGAGGSSYGMVAAGVKVRHAVNHWALALETHNTNHPYTEHYLDDLQQTHPSRYPRTDFAWFSPSCSNHSLAKGRKRKGISQLSFWDKPQVDPAEERNRATMREVVEFTEYHRYEIVIVENVVDIRHWQYYDDWYQAMENLAYHGQTLYLNAQFFGVPQSRDRWYTVFWKHGNRAPDLRFRPAAHCPVCDEEVSAVQSWKNAEFPWGRYGHRRQYVYRCPRCAGEVFPPTVPAYVAIDWDIPAQKIGEREHPLKPKTVERIKVGLRKFARQPVLIDLGHTHAQHQHKGTAADQPLPTQTTCQTLALAVPPFLMSYYTRDSAQSAIDHPIPTIPTENRHSLVIPPFIVPLRGTAVPKGVDEPLTTIIASAQQHAIITPPFVMTYYGRNPVYKEVGEPLSSLTTVQRHALIEPDTLIDDCRFRMLEPDELKRGMSFPDEYIILGSKRDQIKQIGNAVCCHVAAAITSRCIESLN